MALNILNFLQQLGMLALVLGEALDVGLHAVLAL